MLEIEPETVYFLILKAREFDDKDAPGTPDENATPAEETIESNMHYYADDPVARAIALGFLLVLRELQKNAAAQGVEP